MLIIRLLRFGKKHKPFFRLILVEKGRRPGKYLENLGFYNPGEKKHKLGAERIKYWISKGAQLTPSAHNILVAEKIIDKPKLKIKLSKKKVEEVKDKETPKAAEPQKPEALSATKQEPIKNEALQTAEAKAVEPVK